MNNPNKKELWELPNYALMNSDDFLNRVTHLLNLRRRIKLPTGEYTDIKTILDSYVFTMDNFLKMILVILRLRAKIPVILMGETGCGKTSLIRALSALKRANMKTLNIHAGTTDKHIYEFMRTNNALKSSVNPINTTTTTVNKKDNHTWIFLDEINTCNSMGLIAEMMCKRTIFGEPIADTVTFIAACNPYREFTKQTFDIGLVKDKENKNVI
jgi:midasin (ATPase involved in ribosome maturation)